MDTEKKNTKTSLWVVYLKVRNQQNLQEINRKYKNLGTREN